MKSDVFRVWPCKACVFLRKQPRNNLTLAIFESTGWCNLRDDRTFLSFLVKLGCSNRVYKSRCLPRSHWVFPMRWWRNICVCRTPFANWLRWSVSRLTTSTQLFKSIQIVRPRQDETAARQQHSFFDDARPTAGLFRVSSNFLGPLQANISMLAGNVSLSGAMAWLASRPMLIIARSCRGPHFHLVDSPSGSSRKVLEFPTSMLGAKCSFKLSSKWIVLI